MLTESCRGLCGLLSCSAFCHSGKQNWSVAGLTQDIGHLLANRRTISANRRTILLLVNRRMGQLLANRRAGYLLFDRTGN